MQRRSVPVVMKRHPVHDDLSPAEAGTTGEPALDREIAAILDTGPASGQAIRDAFMHKEVRLLALFAGLAPAESSALHRRLAHPDPADAIAARFLRLDVGRRDRLLAFLRDARRREACR